MFWYTSGIEDDWYVVIRIKYATNIYTQEKDDIWLTQSDDKNHNTNKKFKQEAQRVIYRAPEYNVPPFLSIVLGGHDFLK